MARILEDEIASDPLGRGYAVMNDNQLVTSLNTVDRSRNRTAMTSREIADIIPSGLYTALSNEKKVQFLTLLGSDSTDDLNPFGFTMNVLKDIFGPASPAVTALSNARVESISRAVEIGWGVVREKDLRLHTLTRAHPNPNI